MARASEPAPFAPIESAVFEKGLPCSIDTEKALLGSVLLDYANFWKFVDTLNPEVFALEKHRRIYIRMKALADRGEAVDRITLADELIKHGELESIDGLSYLISLDEGLPEIHNPSSYLKIIQEKHALRSAIFMAQRTIDRCMIGEEDSREILDQMEDTARSIRVIDSRDGGTKSSGQIVADFPGGIGAFLDPMQRVKGLRFGFAKLDELTGGMRGDEMLVLGARPGQGKAQPLTARILTRDGWTTMGSIQTGTNLASNDGSPSQVTGVFPQGVKEIFRITFSDGRSTECCADHLWSVIYRDWESPRVVTTSKLQQMLSRKRYKRRVWIPLYTGNHGVRQSLPLDPWLLGALLGDGNLQRTPRFSNPDPYMIQRLRETLPADCDLVSAGGIDWRIRRRKKNNTLSTVAAELERLGLLGKRSWEKSIPAAYLEADRHTRVQLLQGLMDTDGTVEKCGTMYYATSSLMMAEQVQYLARSLGAICSIRVYKAPRYSYKGEVLTGRVAYRLTLSGLDGFEITSRPFHHSRVHATRHATIRLTVTAVESIGKAETQCISTSHPEGLYITDNFVVTHNTAYALNVAYNVASRTEPELMEKLTRGGRLGEADLAQILGVSVFSLEMNGSSLIERILCSTARVDQHRFRLGYLNKEERSSLQHNLAHLNDVPLFIDDNPGGGLDGIAQKLRKDVRERGVKLGIIDYLGLMSQKAENRQNEVSKIARGIKLLTKELHIPILALSQLNRAVDTRAGGSFIPQLSDLRDSGCIAGDSLITMSDGTRRPIASLAGEKDLLSVIGMDQETLKLGVYSVSNVFQTGTRKSYVLTTKAGRSIIATENHKFLTIDGWRRLDELKAGQHVAIPRELSVTGTPIVSRDKLALLAHLIGNGTIVERQPTHYTTFDRDVAEFVGDTARRIFGTALDPEVRPTKNHWDLYFRSTKQHTHGVFSDLRSWLEVFGLWNHRSLNKFIPEFVMGLDRESLSWFVGNLWSTDGCIMAFPDNKHAPLAFYSTSSARLAADVQYLLTRLGIHSTMTPLNQKLSDNPNWHVKISGQKDLLKFCELPAIGERRQKRLASMKEQLRGRIPNTNLDVIPAAAWKSIIKPRFRTLGQTDRSFQAMMGWRYSGSTRYKHCLSREHATKIATVLMSEELSILAASDLYWDRIKSITPGEIIDVYDMTVPGCSNFVADNILVHNSIEQDADLVMFLVREETYRKDRTDIKGQADLYLAKQRNGPIGKIPLTFLGKFTRFEDRAVSDDPGPQED